MELEKYFSDKVNKRGVLERAYSFKVQYVKKLVFSVNRTLQFDFLHLESYKNVANNPN